MPEMIFFTDNYQDRGTREGYQFEFFCKRCGNGYMSSFQHSITGFGGRFLKLGGDLIGGSIGEKAAEVGWDAEWMRDGIRGSTRDKAAAMVQGCADVLGAAITAHTSEWHMLQRIFVEDLDDPPRVPATPRAKAAS